MIQYLHIALPYFAESNRPRKVGISAHPKPSPISAKDKMTDQSSLFRKIKEISHEISYTAM